MEKEPHPVGRLIRETRRWIASGQVLVTLFIRKRVCAAYTAMRARLSQLNGFLHERLPQGHDGKFVAPGELTRDMLAAGFVDIAEFSARVPWRSRRPHP